MIEAVPGCQLAPLVDQHGRLRPAVIGQLLVGGVWGHQGQLDGVDGVCLQDLSEEAGVYHGGLGSVCPHQVDGLGFVLLPLGGVLVNDLPNGDRMGQHAGHKSLQTVEDLLVSRVGLVNVLPPLGDVDGLLDQHALNLLVHPPPVRPGLHLHRLLAPLHLAQLVREVLGESVGETFHYLVNSLFLQVGFVLLTLNVHLLQLLEGDFEGQPRLLLHVLIEHLPLPEHVIGRDELPIRGQHLRILLTELGRRVLGALGACHDGPGSTGDYCLLSAALTGRERRKAHTDLLLVHPAPYLTFIGRHFTYCLVKNREKRDKERDFLSIPCFEEYNNSSMSDI